MFDFVVKYLGFLKAVPLLPQLFDSHLMLWNLVNGSEIPECIDDIEAEVLKWAGTVKTFHKYGGIQFNCRGKELGHIHSNGILDIRFNRQTKAQLIKEGRINEHHIFMSSGWISFFVKTREDTAYATQLLKIAYIKITSKQ
jgi:hypothetical protein